MTKDPFDMLVDAVGKLGDKVDDLAIKTAEHKTKIAIIWYILTLVIAGVIGNIFWELRG